MRDFVVSVVQIGGEKIVKEKILEGASKLFFKYGVRSVTMDDVASYLAISKKTIYQFFKNKDDLITSISMAHMAEEKDEYLQIENVAGDALEEMVQVSSCFRRHMNEINPKLLFELKK